MAAALVNALTNPQTAFAQAKQGQQTVATRYDWSHLADKLERVWLDATTTSGGTP
jgi:glycosyltransferase involved in cell wall biosynthesis